MVRKQDRRAETAGVPVDMMSLDISAPGNKRPYRGACCLGNGDLSSAAKASGLVVIFRHITPRGLRTSSVQWPLVSNSLGGLQVGNLCYLPWETGQRCKQLP